MSRSDTELRARLNTNLRHWSRIRPKALQVLAAHHHLFRVVAIFPSGRPGRASLARLDTQNGNQKNVRLASISLSFAHPVLKLMNRTGSDSPVASRAMLADHLKIGHIQRRSPAMGSGPFSRRSGHDSDSMTDV